MDTLETLLDPGIELSLVLLLLCVVGISWFAGSDAPFVPTKVENLRKILKAAGIKKDKIFYELGSGDGRVVLEASRLGAISYGIEQSWLRVWYSRFKSSREKLSATFFHGNIFDRQYYPADVVYVYMLQDCVDQLEKKLKKELKKGAVIITQKYHFKNWKPTKKIDNFYLYTKTGLTK